MQHSWWASLPSVGFKNISPGGPSKWESLLSLTLIDDVLSNSPKPLLATVESIQAQAAGPRVCALTLMGGPLLGSPLQRQLGARQSNMAPQGLPITLVWTFPWNVTNSTQTS